MTMQASFDELRQKMIRDTEEFLERHLGGNAEGDLPEPVAVSSKRASEDPRASRAAVHLTPARAATAFAAVAMAGSAESP
jgi:hypothetical protein